MPNYYNPYYYQPQPQQMMPAPAPTPAPAPAPVSQMQNGGFVSVRNEEEAQKYPVAPGNSVVFKDETVPFIYTKTMGFSQLDRPVFEKYKLVKEEVAEASYAPQNATNDTKVDTSTINELKGEIEAIWSEIDALKKKSPAPASKRKSVEVVEDE